ncbi:MAG: hypothetical protein NXI10_09425 [bacterium]|nr:hypothetical protein [bacterium]
MRTLLFVLLLLGGLSVTAQTSVIRLKSHHGNLEDLHLSEDKFGIPPPQRWVDTIERISETCVIHYVREQNWGSLDSYRYKDTVCNNWKYEEVDYDPKKIEESYPYEVTLIGFDKDGSRFESKENPYFRKRKRSSFYWLLLPLAFMGLGAYIVQPRLAWKK